MTEQTRQRSSQKNLDSFMEFEDHELQTTMHDFLQEEKKEEAKIWNVATIAGIAMFFVAMLYLIQMIGLGIGPDLGGLITWSPLIGGVLVTLVGFGFLVGDQKKNNASQSQRRPSDSGEPVFDFESRGDASEFNIDNDLDEDSYERRSSRRGTQTGTRSGSRTGSNAEAFRFDDYALNKPKKLYKSRTDRKWLGVCGGLAKYLGISSTVIRLLFVIFTFASSGVAIPAYIVLGIVLDKEPPELMDDFNF
ncbi:MAG: PspC domain-containing protein [Balneolaceae bacterium]|nr:PspC domain-containing protein [Balneolaceae bacterium]